MIPQPPAHGLSWITNSLIFPEHVIMKRRRKKKELLRLKYSKVPFPSDICIDGMAISVQCES